MDFLLFLSELHKIKYGVVAFNTYDIGTKMHFYLMVANKGNSGTFYKTEGTILQLEYLLDDLLNNICYLAKRDD